MADAFSLIDGLLHSSMSALGRIVVETREPHFIVAINGPGASMLQASSSRLCGRRAQGIAQRGVEQQRLNEALHRVKNLRKRVFLKTLLQAGHGVSPALAVIQICEVAG